MERELDHLDTDIIDLGAASVETQGDDAGDTEGLGKRKNGITND